MTTMARQCARPGCRGWPTSGSDYCRWHQHVHDPPDAGTAHQRQLRELRFAQLLQDGRHDEVVDPALREAIAAAGSNLSLGEEIGALRLVLRRVVAIDALDADPRHLATTMARLVEVIVRTVRMQHTLAGQQTDDISAAITRILTDIGLGDEP